MANYYIDEASSQLTIGAISGVEEPAGQVRNIVLTNVNPNNNSWNGLTIQAKNFKIKDGNLVAPVSNETYIWNNSGSVWDADDKINQVVFTNLGTIGTQDNKVNMAITFNAFTPTDNVNVNINLEESELDPIVPASHEFSLPISWTSNDNHTVTTSSDYTKTVDSATKHTFSGTVLSHGPVVVAAVTFVADSLYYYNENHIYTAFQGTYSYAGLYSAEIVDLVHTDFNLTGFTVRYEFNWSAFVDVMGDAADLYTDNILVFGPPDSDITHTIHEIPSASTENRIHSVSYPPSLTSSQGEIPIRVFGSANAPYKLSIEKKASTTSIVTASSNGYYNFDTRAFQTAVTSLSSTCDAKGTNVNYVLLPDVSSDTRYDITVSGVVAGSTTVLNSNVPQKAGDAIITKYGIDTITVKPITYIDPTPYGTLPANIAISKEKPIPGKSSGSANLTSVIAKGGTGGASSKRLVMNETASGIFSGMVVTGSGVAHNSTVTAVSKNIVTLSVLSTIVNNTDIRFTENTVNLKPFTFTVVPTGGSVLNVTATANKRGCIGGLTSVKTRINGADKSTATYTVDSTKGIVPGMVVTGTEVKVDAGTDLTVGGVTSATVLVFSETQTFNDNASLVFSGGNVVADTSLHSIQVNKVDPNIVITGYIVSSNISATADVRVYIDDLITVT